MSAASPRSLVAGTDASGAGPPKLSNAAAKASASLDAAAFNDARAKADAVSGEEMGKMTAGLPLPPGFKLPF